MLTRIRAGRRGRGFAASPYCWNQPDTSMMASTDVRAYSFTVLAPDSDEMVRAARFCPDPTSSPTRHWVERCRRDGR